MTHPVPVLSALAVAALALGAPAAAGDTQGWDVTENGKTCLMVSTFEDDVSVGLIWAAPNGDVSFMTAGDDLEKIAGKAGATVALDIKFDGQVPHTDWTDDVARVVSVGNHRVAVIGNWGPSLSKELADTVAGSGKVSVRVGDKDLGSYDLAGSRAASDKLTQCGTQIAAK